MATFNQYPAAQIQLPNFAQALGQAQSLKAGQQQMKLTEMKMAAAERAADRDAKIQSLQGKAVGGDQAAAQQLAGLDLERASQVQSYTQSDQKFRALAIARGVQQAQSPDEVYALAVRHGKTPEQAQRAAQNFAADPEGYRNDAAMGALSIREQFAQKNNVRDYERGVQEDERDYGFDREKFGETRRHNRASEAAAAVRARTAQTVIKMPPGEAAFDKELGKKLATDYVEIQAQVPALVGRVQRLKDLKGLARNIYTGAGGDTALKIKKLAKSLGISVEGLGDAEAFQAAANKMALEARSTADGAGMPGAMSEKDREFLVNITPNLTTTREGNLAKIEAAERVATRQMEYARLQTEYAKQNGGRLDAGWLPFASQYFADKPLFDDMRESLPRATGGPGAVMRFDRRGQRMGE